MFLLFKSIMFLVRDWINHEDNDFGLRGGEEYLTDMLDTKDCKEGSSRYSVRQQLHQSFEKIQCFLMPHPGQKVIGAKKNYKFEGILAGMKYVFSALNVLFSWHLIIFVLFLR